MAKYTISGTVDLTPVDEVASGVAPQDILVSASADKPFSGQSGYTAQTINRYVGAADIPETGIHGSALPNGETLRIGKVANPTASGSKALCFQCHRADPMTSGGIRSELSCTKNIEWNKTYWLALACYVQDWSSLPSGDEALFGCQMHSGDDGGGWSPSFALYTRGNGREFDIRARWANTDPPNTNNTTSKWFENRPTPFGRWTDWVFKFRHSAEGLLQVWMDDTRIVDYQGKLGFNVGLNDYAKFGYYCWTEDEMNNAARKVLLREPHIVRDSGYTVEQVRDLLSGS